MTNDEFVFTAAIGSLTFEKVCNKKNIQCPFISFSHVHIIVMTKLHKIFIFLLLSLKFIFCTKIDPDLISFNAKLWSKLLTDQTSESESQAESDDINTDDDIRAIKRQKVEFSNGFDNNFGSVVGEESIPWPNAEIPYTIDSIKFDQTFLMEFNSALKEFHTKTCVKFRPKRNGDRYFIKIIKDEGCWSYVGLQPELMDIGQEVSLGEECWRKGIIIHEFTHVLGFFHEHSRFDRDSYINLNVNNIQKNRIRQFDKRPKEKVDEFGTYDFLSILHYEPTAFAIDKRHPTIVPKIQNGKLNEMGQRKKLSEGDIAKINAFYNCTSHFGDLNGFKPSKIASNYKEIKTDSKSFKSYNLNKNNNNPGVATFKSLEDFRIRTGRREPPPGFTFAFSSDSTVNNKLREQNEFTNFKQYPSMDENYIKKKIIQCSTKESGNCMDRLDNCYDLAMNKQCEKKPGYMLKMCRRSCCNCDDKKCFDTNDPSKFNTLCAARNEKGVACSISASRQNALDFCPLTCGICQI